MSNTWRWFRVAAPVVIALPVVFACTTRSIEKPSAMMQKETPLYFPQTLEKDVDLLFVIDNSSSMTAEQKELINKLPLMIEALRSPKLGKDKKDGPECTPTDRQNCRLPNLQIGVINVDLAAGPYEIGTAGKDYCNKSGGSGAKLLNQPMITGCTPPKDPWISYAYDEETSKGSTNIPSAAVDPVKQVKDAFQCIGSLGAKGESNCLFEHQLESARRALDPQLKTNPGFLRQEAFLAVVFITDEDDCSAKDTELFTDSSAKMAELGPQRSFRCTEFGITCDGKKVARIATPEPLKNCVPGVPGHEWLYPVEEYKTFFQNLKPGRTILFAIAGRPEPFMVDVDPTGKKPAELRYSCASRGDGAVPAIRIKTVVESMGKDRGYFNKGADDSGNVITLMDIGGNEGICSEDFGPALKLLGNVIRSALGGQCISSPPLTSSGTIACGAGDTLSDGISCKNSCLDQADCVVQEAGPQGAPVNVEKCPSNLFDPNIKDCGGSCPCWRIIPNKECDSAKDGSPYGLNILRQSAPAKGTMARLYCQTTPFTWGSKEFGALPQCK